MLKEALAVSGICMDAESSAGAQGKFFLGALVQKFFRKKFSGGVRYNCFPAILPRFFIPNFGTLPPKNQISCQQKSYRGPLNLGARGNLTPPAPPLGDPGYMDCELIILTVLQCCP
jgi:hypothetical protein